MKKKKKSIEEEEEEVGRHWRRRREQEVGEKVKLRLGILITRRRRSRTYTIMQEKGYFESFFLIFFKWDIVSEKKSRINLIFYIFFKWGATRKITFPNKHRSIFGLVLNQLGLRIRLAWGHNELFQSLRILSSFMSLRQILPHIFLKLCVPLSEFSKSFHVGLPFSSQETQKTQDIQKF